MIFNICNLFKKFPRNLDIIAEKLTGLSFVDPAQGAWFGNLSTAAATSQVIIGTVANAFNWMKSPRSMVL
ncbi:MAG TPA: hypothetical protein VGM27_14470 [Acidobacteriaceae bacterium]|jgi:hypothetical protein